jgi:uncharacterized membrane protein YozB (DUF420 family)
MAYKLGLRLLAAFCFLTVIGTPFGIFFLWLAGKEERKEEQHRENVAAAANNN